MADEERRSRRVRGRDPRARLDDHEAISRLADELLPSLIAKLGATGLGEIEVREGEWRVRLRLPADAARTERRAGDRSSRSQPGHAGHGHPPAALEVHRTGPGRTSGMPVPVGPGPAADGGGGTGRGDADGADGAHVDDYRAVATSPAVGVFQPRPEISSGTRVRAGDRLGFVDMLGIPQDVVSPVDGIVGASLVEPGEAVEYGQQLIRIELASAPSRRPETAGPPVAATAVVSAGSAGVSAGPASVSAGPGAPDPGAPGTPADGRPVASDDEGPAAPADEPPAAPADEPPAAPGPETVASGEA
jgi:biotin carboxyl carrier protein